MRQILSRIYLFFQQKTYKKIAPGREKVLTLQVKILKKKFQNVNP